MELHEEIQTFLEETDTLSVLDISDEDLAYWQDLQEKLALDDKKLGRVVRGGQQVDGNEDLGDIARGATYRQKVKKEIARIEATPPKAKAKSKAKSRASCDVAELDAWGEHSDMIG